MSDDDQVYEDEWLPEDTGVPWQTEGRKKLNELIRLYNEWVIRGGTSNSTLSRRMECGLQTFAKRNGGDEWRVVIERMKARIDAAIAKAEREFEQSRHSPYY